MATLRKASSYTRRKVTPFTRTSRKRKKAFIKTNPPQKIVKFDMGEGKLFRDGKLPHVLTVVSEEKVQIRHNAFESVRQYINKKLDKETNKNYFFKIIPYPHHIQRENKMLTGAGADRMQTGMQLSFGKTVGKAAIVKPGTKIFRLALSTEKDALFARNVIKQIKPKLPCKIRIDYEFTGTKK